MTHNRKRWAGVALVVSMMALGAGAAHGQSIQGDLWQLRRDQQLTRRDSYQLNRDIAVGNAWGIQRDFANLQRDRQDLAIDRQNLRDDALFNTLPYPPSCGAYPPPASVRPPTYWGGSPYGGVGVGVGPAYPGGVVRFPYNRPW